MGTRQFLLAAFCLVSTVAAVWTSAEVVGVSCDSFSDSNTAEEVTRVKLNGNCMECRSPRICGRDNMSTYCQRFINQGYCLNFADKTKWKSRCGNPRSSSSTSIRASTVGKSSKTAANAKPSLEIILLISWSVVSLMIIIILGTFTLVRYRECVKRKEHVKQPETVASDSVDVPLMDHKAEDTVTRVNEGEENVQPAASFPRQPTEIPGADVVASPLPGDKGYYQGDGTLVGIMEEHKIELAQNEWGGRSAQPNEASPASSLSSLDTGMESSETPPSTLRQCEPRRRTKSERNSKHESQSEAGEEAPQGATARFTSRPDDVCRTENSSEC